MDVRLPGNVGNQARSHGIFHHSLTAAAPADSYGKTAVRDVPSDDGNRTQYSELRDSG
jgi:hypothetical protein